MPLPSHLIESALATSTSNRRDQVEDWETAYSDEDNSTTEVGTGLDNVAIWNAPPQQQYSIISSQTTHSTSYASSSRLPPTQAVFGPPPPKMMILKRPTTNGGVQRKVEGGAGGNGEVTTSQVKTLKQRELDYEQARRKLFGDEQEQIESFPSSNRSYITDSKYLNTTPDQLGNALRSVYLVPDSVSRAKARKALVGGATTSSSNSNSVAGSREASPRRTNGGKETLSGNKTLVGVVRHPRGPNAESGGFGFVAPTASTKDSGRGRGRGKGKRSR